ncbi:HalOD1 output domain-containing protein [Halocatena halophila]|uniref:HalOD1 output domain-containing protein n=1 Tax=Halocatena halophila TaxID=2814576 RepID=UPI002ED39D82
MKARNETEAIMGDITDSSDRTIAESATTFRFDRDAQPLGVQVIEAVGATTGLDETEITAPLYKSVDPEALDTLFATGGDGSVQFSFDGHHITIEVMADGTGTITVE